ncbi:MAG: hypothetical protein SFU56_15500 [Capsulimonadales bacterium]|nr:hypothetical protein [Capsulimonadales bacterium]
MAAPDRLRIPYEDDEYSRFDLVGKYGEDQQFMAFITGAMPMDWSVDNYSELYLRTNWQRHKRWYAVVHHFDADGNHLRTDARLGGTDDDPQIWDQADQHLKTLVDELGPLRLEDINVCLFSVEIDNYLFGLIYERLEEDVAPEEDIDWVMLEPNDIMFHRPWDSGEYST